MLLLALGLLSAPAGAGDPAFVDRAAGDFDFGTPDGGLSVIDYDLDGFLDLVVGDGIGDPIHLFHNEPDPAHPGGRTFVDRTAGSGLDDAEALARASGGPANVPFHGGTLCVDPATLRRSVAVVDTSGTGSACDGVLELDVNAFAAGRLGGHPAAFLSVPGSVVCCQYWARDTLAHGSLLSDALAFFVDP